MLICYQRSRFRFKSSCSIAFLRNVEPQESASWQHWGWKFLFTYFFFVSQEAAAAKLKTRKMVPITWRASPFLEFLFV